MAKQVINLGTAPSGAGGDDRRSAWVKAIANFDEIYNFIATAFNRANVVGTVSQSAGVPTGALMERGSNANGTYEKYACGTLICRRSLAVSRTINVAYNGAFAATGAEPARTFPAAFSSMPAISIEANGTGAPTMIGYQDFSFSDTAYSGWPAVLLYGTAARAAQYYTICYLAIGRWFE